MFDSSIIQLSATPVHHAMESDLISSFRQAAARLMQDRLDEETIFSIEGYNCFQTTIAINSDLHHGDEDCPAVYYEEQDKKPLANLEEKKNFLKAVNEISSNHLQQIIKFFLKKAKTSVQLVYQENNSLRHRIFNCVDYDAVFYVSSIIVTVANEKTIRTVLSFLTTNSDLYAKVKKFCDDHVVDPLGSVPAAQSKVFLLSKDSNRYFFNTFKLQSHDFLPCAFSKENNEYFHGIVDKLASKKPFGRIHIFHGPPGTGKTSFIKSLITETLKKFATSPLARKGNDNFFDSRKIIFLYIPITTFSFFSSPEAIGTLLDEGFSETSRIVFIIEDADNLIKKREFDGNDKDTLSNLLNFCDGITGQIFDIQCVVTSNIQLDNIDPAFVRPGRLGSIVHFSPLDREEKEGFCKQFDIDVPDGEKTIAELFEIVNTKKLLEEQLKVQEASKNSLLQGTESPDIIGSLPEDPATASQTKKSKKGKRK